MYAYICIHMGEYIYAYTCIHASVYYMFSGYNTEYTEFGYNTE